jgi:hypothetical protein
LERLDVILLPAVLSITNTKAPLNPFLIASIYSVLMMELRWVRIDALGGFSSNTVIAKSVERYRLAVVCKEHICFPLPYICDVT